MSLELCEQKLGLAVDERWLMLCQNNLTYKQSKLSNRTKMDKKICIDGESNPGRDEFVVGPSLKAGWQRPVIPLHYQCFHVWTENC